MQITIHSLVAISALATVLPATADLTVEIAQVTVPEGAGAVSVPVTVRGSDPVTDMNAIVQVAGGGPLAGGAPAPKVTGIDFASTIWADAPGGFVSFFASASPASEIVDPSLSLLKNGESVTAAGPLMTIGIDTASFPIGEYPIIMAGTAAGNSELLNAGSPVPTTFLPGAISILRALDHWRRLHFGSQVENPLLQDSIWGNDADPDLDGLTNLYEFGIGTDPNSPGHNPATPSSTGIPTASVLEIAGNSYLELTYSMRKTATDFTFEVSSSNDQLNWQTPAPGLTRVGAPVAIGDGLYQFVRVRLPLENGSSRLFARLSAQHLP